MSEGPTTQEEHTIPFYPDHVSTEAKVAVAFILLAVLVGVLAMLWQPVGLGDPADPLNTPAHTKPEWYFLFLYQLLKYVPKTLGVLLPIVGMLILAVWPFFDRREDNPRARRRRVVLTLVVLSLILILTLLGELA